MLKTKTGDQDATYGKTPYLDTGCWAPRSRNSHQVLINYQDEKDHELDAPNAPIHGT